MQKGGEVVLDGISNGCCIQGNGYFIHGDKRSMGREGFCYVGYKSIALSPKMQNVKLVTLQTQKILLIMSMASHFQFLYILNT